MTAQADSSNRLRRQWLSLLAILLILIGLALAWSWSPLRSWLAIDEVVAKLQYLGRTYGPLVTIGGFALAVTLAVPLTFLTLVTLVALGPWLGFACAISGALVGACLSYGLGRYLGREVLERLAGERVNLLSRRLAKRGVLAIVVVRLVPIAPFAIVNMATGASHISLRDVLLGTAIGMTPSTVFMMIFMNPLIAALRQPSSQNLLLLLIPAALVGAAIWGARRWIRQNNIQSDS
jgi:uncharacterized membrane protein YdjX (TVP38/TMEM64 family)